MSILDVVNPITEKIKIEKLGYAVIPNPGGTATVRPTLANPPCDFFVTALPIILSTTSSNKITDLDCPKTPKSLVGGGTP